MSTTTTTTYHNAEGYFAVNEDGEPSEYFATKGELSRAVEDGSAWSEQLRQPPLFEGLHWQSGQVGLFDSPRELPPASPVSPEPIVVAATAKRVVNREMYSEGYQAGVSGQKLPVNASHADCLAGYEHGAADRRYNQRVADHGRVFKGWATLPGQSEFNVT